jgi:exosortase A
MQATENPVMPAKLALYLTLALAWALFWYWDSYSGMVSLWNNSDTYAHGFVVLPIVAWLIWNDRAKLSDAAPRPTLMVILPAIALSFSWLIGQITTVNALAQFSALAMGILLIVSLLGTEISRRLAFPLSFLFFALPMGEFMMPTLMDWTANFTVLALRLSGIPVYREGLQFIIPSGNWSVVEACSGIRYIIASFMVGTLFAYLNYRSLKRRLIFVAVSLIVPIIANWLRAYFIVLLGHLTSNKLATGADHLIYGWVFFGLIMMGVFAIGMRWSEESPKSTQARFSGFAAPTERISWLPPILVAIIMAAGPLAYAQLAKSHPVANPQIPPLALAGEWQATAPFSAWKPAYAAPSAEQQAYFERDGKKIGTYVGFYRNQNFTRKLITSTNMLVQYQDKDWRATKQFETVASIGQDSAEVRAAEIAGSDHLTAYAWYWIDGRLTTSQIIGKLYTALSTLLGHGDDSAIVVVFTPSTGAQGKAILDEFLAVNGSQLGAMIEAARGTD